jgi:zinc and cadmium transporter
MLLWVLAFGTLGSIGTAIGSALVMALPGPALRRILPYLLSYATGTLLGAAFLGMVPHAVGLAPALPVLATLLAGIVLFFVLEKLMLWRHCHEEECNVHGQAGSLILVGDAFHNLVDGAVIAAGFLTSVPLGVAAALAVIAHEIPQEVGDFAILLDSGYGRSRAFALNLLSASATLPGALLAYLWLAETRAAIPYILALSAASFIYIAVADLIPGLHRQVAPAVSLRQLAMLSAGIGTIALFSVEH